MFKSSAKEENMQIHYKITKINPEMASETIAKP